MTAAIVVREASAIPVVSRHVGFASKWFVWIARKPVLIVSVGSAPIISAYALTVAQPTALITAFAASGANRLTASSVG